MLSDNFPRLQPSILRNHLLSQFLEVQAGALLVQVSGIRNDVQPSILFENFCIETIGCQLIGECLRIGLNRKRSSHQHVQPWVILQSYRYAYLFRCWPFHCGFHFWRKGRRSFQGL